VVVRLKILGNGGFVSNGLAYNSFIINNVFLVEAPPDIMVSLRNQDMDIGDLRMIFLSHYHGDHCFGMPFLVLNLMMRSLKTGTPVAPIDIIGPRGLRPALIRLQQTAISEDHPSIDFIDELFRFHEVDSSSRFPLDGANHLVFHEMSHPQPTYGFSIINGTSYTFTYLSDTVWSDSFVPILAKKPPLVFCDLNAKPDESNKKHMCEDDILCKAIPITGVATRYIGMHLSDNEGRDIGQLHYSRVGVEYEIGKQG
jgi:ribonuclease BN (tRNA processing enzyme)